MESSFKLSRCSNWALYLFEKELHNSRKMLFVKFVVEFYERVTYTISRSGGAYSMPNIKPVSELRNYGEVLRDVAVGAPVFLTKNGHGRYAVLDIAEYQEYEKMRAWQRLKAELDAGRRSGETEGWLSAEEVETELGIRCD
jgi:prevent-host-death family protein